MARPSTHTSSGTTQRLLTAPAAMPTKSTAATPSENPRTLIRPTRNPVAQTPKSSSTGFWATSEITPVWSAPPPGYAAVAAEIRSFYGGWMRAGP
jgi:hypothetical protein